MHYRFRFCREGGELGIILDRVYAGILLPYSVLRTSFA